MPRKIHPRDLAVNRIRNADLSAAVRRYLHRFHHLEQTWSSHSRHLQKGSYMPHHNERIPETIFSKQGLSESQRRLLIESLHSKQAGKTVDGFPDLDPAILGLRLVRLGAEKDDRVRPLFRDLQSRL